MRLKSFLHIKQEHRKFQPSKNSIIQKQEHKKTSEYEMCDNAAWNQRYSVVSKQQLTPWQQTSNMA
jgi:hypothetical protein